MSTPVPNCPDCGGTGLILQPSQYPHPPTTVRCMCVVKQDLLANVDRALPHLSKAPAIPKSPLTEKTGENLWITEGLNFLAHLRHVGIRQPLTWSFKVVSDAELVTAWLASASLRGQEIMDPDAYMVSTRFMTIPDLVIPPDLVVIRMGVKVARNQASPEVLAEALNLRMHEGKPTWVWDEPVSPLNVGHLFWSDAVGRILTGWERIQGLSTPAKAAQAIKPMVTTGVSDRPVLGGIRKSLRGAK